MGLTSLSFQIYLMREFIVHFFGNEIILGFILASWLFWAGIGSLFADRLHLRIKKFSSWYFFIILLFCSSLILIRFSRFLFGNLPGEVIGLFPSFVAALCLTLLVSFPLGILFVLNVHFSEGNITSVYLWESVGAAFGGLIVHFLLVPFLSNWKASAFLGMIITLSIFFLFRKKREAVLLITSLIVLFLLFPLDNFTQKIHWKPFKLAASKDTPYGKLQVVRSDEQINLYNNGLPVYSYPDFYSAEESVHFTLLQYPEANNVLLIGGGAGGSLAEILKYPCTHIDYVEIDPAIITLSVEYLPKKDAALFHDPRVIIHYQDGRSFLSQTKEKYDLILLNIPDPATIQINRFYTVEFFELVKKRLNEPGYFSFRVSSAENYISPELQNYLSSLHTTLNRVFPKVEIVPGSSNIFLGSPDTITLDETILSSRLKTYDIKNKFITPQMLPIRLDPFRIDFLKEKISQKTGSLNTDLKPVSYFFNSVLWAKQFLGIEGKIFKFFEKLNFFWLLDFPLILVVLFFIYSAVAKKRSVFLLMPLAVIGLTTLVTEILVIMSFQVYYGYLYKKIALLFAAFMLGLAVGSAVSAGKPKKINHIPVLQIFFVLVLLLLYNLFSTKPPEVFFFFFLFILGILSGYLFILLNHLYLKNKKSFGTGYGIDLLGSFIGALVASSLLVPLVGLQILLFYLILLNSFSAVFSLWTVIRPKYHH